MSQYIGARANEFFTGNVRATAGIPGHLAGLQTARLGEKALDIEGHPLPGYLPLFIGRSEAGAYDEIMMRRFRAGRVQAPGAAPGAAHQPTEGN